MNDIQTISFPIQAMCHVPKPPVAGATVTSAQVTLQGRLTVYPGHVELSVVDPVIQSVAFQSIAIPTQPAPVPETDAEVLRRIADALNFTADDDFVDPDWSDDYDY